MTTWNIRSARVIAAVMLLQIASTPTATTGQSNTSTTFSGRATVIQGTIAGIDLNLSDTGPLDPSGGARENSLLCYPDGPDCQIGVPDVTGGAVSAKVLHASTVGRGEHSRSRASAAEVSITVAGIPIQADLITAIAEASCQAGVAAVSGGAQLVNLVIDNVPVAVTGEPNQTLSVGPVTIVLNEHMGGASGGTGDITVNALHVTVDDVRDPTGVVLVPGTDLVIAQAHADIRCGQRLCNFADKVTGGGFVFNSNGARLNFAIAGRNLSDWGHFQAINHATRDQMKATQLTTTFDAEGFAVVSGTAQVNGAGTFTFTVRVRDEGEPGRDDLFELSSSHPNMNVPLTTLGGGNLQFHKPCKN